MPANEKEITVNLLREKHHVDRIERAARREGATVESILEAIEQEQEEIKKCCIRIRHCRRNKKRRTKKWSEEFMWKRRKNSR